MPSKFHSHFFIALIFWELRRGGGGGGVGLSGSRRLIVVQI